MLHPTKSAVRLALALAAVMLLVGWQWWRSRPLGSTTFPDGTEIVFERYTSGTVHEFGGPDLRKLFRWLPAGWWKAIRYQAPFGATMREAEPCTVLWVRVRWKPDRQEPIPSDLDVQVVEQDGTAYPWRLICIYQTAPTEFVLPYRAESLPPRGGRLTARFVEKLEQRKHLSKDYVARNANLKLAQNQTSGSLLLPNPSRAKSGAAAPPPLPQVQEREGLRATLRAIQVKPRPNGEFMVEPQVELRWNGEELANAFRHYWSISTPGGPETEPGFRLSMLIDHMPEYPPQPHMLPTAPMRGHREWTLHLHVVSTAEFPELEKERGIPMFTAPVAARDERNGPPPPKPAVSPEASEAGLGIADVWPPRFLRLVVHRTPERWFPARWKHGDPLPFVVVAEAGGKRVLLGSSSAGGGYGRYGLASFDFGTDVAQRLAYGEDSASKIEGIPPGDRPALPKTAEYRLIPRRYWTFAFVVVPPEPPEREN